MSNFKHCDPCDNFGICINCEIEMCNTCGESFDSPHMHLTEESHDEIDRLKAEDDLYADRFCNECIFYTHHDINTPEQEEYDHDMIFEVEEYQDGTEIRNFGSAYNSYPKEVPKWRTRVVITGIKPEPTYDVIRGPFIFKENEISKEHRAKQGWRISISDRPTLTKRNVPHKPTKGKLR